jgi:hypothetical protein
MVDILIVIARLGLLATTCFIAHITFDLASSHRGSIRDARI